MSFFLEKIFGKCLKNSNISLYEYLRFIHIIHVVQMGKSNKTLNLLANQIETRIVANAFLLETF